MDEARALELRRQELEQGTKRRLEEMKKRHQEELNEKDKDVKFRWLREEEANKNAEDAKKELHMKKGEEPPSA